MSSLSCFILLVCSKISDDFFGHKFEHQFGHLGILYFLGVSGQSYVNK